ncbi:MAG: trypsin-like peptidase domain-containing protein [Acutalibacteraceae bacterium]|nr:trypsin-like peptidase domain-containing protein [Acutalibacteraceae bacterium]
MDNSNSNNTNNSDSYIKDIALENSSNTIPLAESKENINEFKNEAPQQRVADNSANTAPNSPYMNQPTPQIPIGNYNNAQQAQPQWSNQPPVYNRQANPVPPQPQWSNQPPVYNRQPNPVPPQPQWSNQPPVYNRQANPAPPQPQWSNQPPVYNRQANPAPPQQAENKLNLNKQQDNPAPQADNTDIKENTSVNNAYIPSNTDTESNINTHKVPDMQSTANVYSNPNVYAEPYSTDIPHIEYIPYIPGTPLPKGVEPEFINGGWYYAININPKKQKKKMSTPVKVFVGIIIALTILFTGLLIGWTIHLTDKNGANKDLFDFENPFKTEEKDKDSDSKPSTGALANPNGPEIKLDKNNTKDGSTEKAYEVLSESVVSISVYNEDEEPSTSTPISEGTGIIISADGYIVTNSHVVLDNAESNAWITTKSGDVYPAGIVGCDTRTDLAVLKCEDVSNWKVASFADSDEISVGQDVVAIGSPGGSSYSNSLTKGIVSAIDRVLSGSAVTYIQTDAAINPGNSGGPLANMNGQVIGINTIKVVDTQFEGMGFAIPSVTIKEVADEIIKNGYVTGRAKLGVSVTEFSDYTAKLYDAPAGIKVDSIDKESSVTGKDVKVGDIITKIDGTPTTTFNDLFNVLDSHKPGDTVTLTIYRIDEKDKAKGKEFTVKVELLGD